MKSPAQGGSLTFTPAQVREAMRQHGVTVSKWAKENNFNASIVKDVLAGRIKGNYGKSHAIAVALGIKPRAGKAPAFLAQLAASNAPTSAHLPKSATSGAFHSAQRNGRK